MLINKYGPQSLNECVINQDKAAILLNMCEQRLVPHLLLYGPSGSGRKTLISLLIKELYGSYNCLKTYFKTYDISCSGSKVISVEIEQSLCHIIIEPTGTNFDKYLIQDVIKEFLKVPISFEFGKKSLELKTIIINNLHTLSYYAQASLRSTIETNSYKCRFVMWSDSLTKIMSPIISRCFCMCIQRPNLEELMRHFVIICASERITMNQDDIYKIIKNSEQSIEKMLWFLECYKYGIDPETNYGTLMNMMVNIIFTCKLEYIQYINILGYNITTITVTSISIIEDIVNRLLILNLEDTNKDKIVKIAALVDHNMVLKRREVIQFDNFIIPIMQILNNDKNFKKTNLSKDFIVNFIEKNKVEPELETIDTELEIIDEYADIVDYGGDDIVIDKVIV